VRKKQGTGNICDISYLEAQTGPRVRIAIDHSIFLHVFFEITQAYARALVAIQLTKRQFLT